ncbi:MAG TPA: cytochrome c-type biogenesis protein CcmH [Bryobacteraceae bacterium]
MPARLRRFNLKLAAAFLLAFATLLAQDITNFLTPDVARVGARLACRCGGCKNTVGDCPMLRCSYTDPMRHRIYEMKQHGASDNEIVNAIVREGGVAVLSSPQPLGIFVWLMPGIALLLGFLVYTSYVRRNRKTPEPLTAGDQSIIDRFRTQIDRELDESAAPRRGGADARK